MSFPCKKDSIVAVKVGSCCPSNSGSRSGSLGQFTACEGCGPRGTLEQPALSNIKLSSKTFVLFTCDHPFLVCCFLQLLLDFLIGDQLAQLLGCCLAPALIQLTLDPLRAVIVTAAITPYPEAQERRHEGQENPRV